MQSSQSDPNTPSARRRPARTLWSVIAGGIAAAGLLPAQAHDPGNGTDRRVAISVLRAPDPATGSASPVAHAAVDQVVQRRGGDSIVSSSRTSDAGDATLLLRSELGGAIRIRAIGYVPQRLPLPLQQSDSTLVIRLTERPMRLERICIHMMAPGAVLRFRRVVSLEPVPLRVRAWATRPRKTWVDASPVLLPGADTTMSFDAPTGVRYNISVQARGFRPWARTAIRGTGRVGCGEPGIKLDVVLRPKR
jgi:hypothetical protein